MKTPTEITKGIDVMSGEYDPEATVEFEPIERPLSEVEGK